MARSLTRFASFLRPIGKGSDEIVAVKLHNKALTVAEVRHKSNVINIGQLASVALPRKLDIQNLARQQDMIGDVLRSLRDQIGFTAQDAGLIIPGGIVQIRQLNLPFMTPAELAKEAEDPAFWIELEPDIGKLEDPFISYDTLVSSENDDLTRVVIGFAENASLRQWSDTLLTAHLNPVYLELEPVALANQLYTVLPPEDRAQAQAILHVSGDRMELIAFQSQRFDVVKLEISEFDQVLLSEIEDVPDTGGEFWDEVGGRVANTLKQAVLYLQEEQDFPTFPVVHVVIDALRGQNFMTLMDHHFSLAPVRLWDPLANAEMAPNVQTLMSQVSNRSGFTSALGLALRRLGTFGNEGPGILRLSMLPQSATLRRNRQLGVITRTMFVTWLATLLLMGAWTGGLVAPAFLESQAASRGFEGIKAEAEAAQSQIGQFNEVVTQLDATLETLNVVSRQRGKAYIIETLPDLVPEGMELSDYLLTNDVDLTLRGAAGSPDVVQLFVSELQNSGLVEQPALSEPILREGGSVYDFEITTKLRQEN